MTISTIPDFVSEVHPISSSLIELLLVGTRQTPLSRLFLVILPYIFLLFPLFQSVSSFVGGVAIHCPLLHMPSSPSQ